MCGTDARLSDGGNRTSASRAPHPDINRPIPRFGQSLARQRGAANQALLITITLAVLGLLAASAVYLYPVEYDSATSLGEAGGTTNDETRQAPVLRLVGSNTIGSTLAPALAKAYLQQRLGAVRVQFDQALGQHQQWIEGFLPGEAVPRRIQVVATGSGFAFEALARGEADIGMSSRAISPPEEERLATLGNMRGRECEHVLGLDGIAVIVHPGNPIDTMSVDQLSRVFGGAVRTWGELGGPKRPINRYARNRESGTYASFLALIAPPSQKLARNTRFIVESAELSDAVANDPNGIGFVGLPYIGKAKAVRVAAANHSPFYPTQLSVYREDYPLSRRLYLYTPAGPSSPMAADFVDFALSPIGQQVVESAGFVGRRVEPVAGSAIARPLPPDAPKRYVELFDTADAVPFTVRFKPDSAEPDNKAWTDLPRLMQLLISPQYRNREVILAAFGDHGAKSNAAGSGPPDAIAALKTALEQSGIRNVRIENFGPALPLVPSNTPDGREKNRRVELWLSR